MHCVVVRSNACFAGDTGMEASIRTCLDGLAAKGAEALLPTTVLFVEVPTNPDMKVSTCWCCPLSN